MWDWGVTEIAGSIDDLLMIILLCLPVRSLIRFKSVSKHWFSLITDPKFCDLRSSRKINPAVGLFFYNRHDQPPPYNYIPFSLQKKPTNAPSISHDFSENPFESFILDSCNGLFLCCSKYRFTSTYYVYNPTTNNKTLIPELQSGILSCTLAFDPVKSSHYKLVLVAMKYASDPDQIQIYSSEIGGWRIEGVIERYKSTASFSRGVYWNGFVHWIPYMGSNLYSLRFHVETQVLDIMPTPPNQYLPHLTGARYVRESCDHLYYIQSGPQFNVFEMKRDYSEWFIKYTVDLSPVIAAYPTEIKDSIWGLQHYLSIISFVHGEEEDPILVFLIPGKIMKYNLVDGEFEKLSEFEF